MNKYSKYLNRRNFLATSAGLLILGGCSKPVNLIATYEADTTDGPVFVFDDAIVRSNGSKSFVGDLTGEKLKYFDKIFFVNKSAAGVYSQTLKILEPDEPGVENTAWRVTETMDISTGREMNERYFTTTPRGIFTFDKNRYYREYQSRQWDGADMPFAMFLDYVYPSGRPTGIAFHSTTHETEKYLGIRASGGCVRLSMKKSKEVFELVGRHKGMVPDFVDKNPRGKLRRRSDGTVRMKSGFRVLIIIEDNAHIQWEPFVGDVIWQRRLDNKKVITQGPSYFEVLDAAINAGQN